MYAKPTATLRVSDLIPIDEFTFVMISIIIPKKVPSDLAHVTNDFFISPRTHEGVGRDRVNNRINKDSFAHLREQPFVPVFNLTKGLVNHPTLVALLDFAIGEKSFKIRDGPGSLLNVEQIANCIFRGKTAMLGEVNIRFIQANREIG